MISHISKEGRAVVSTFPDETKRHPSIICQRAVLADPKYTVPLSVAWQWQRIRMTSPKTSHSKPATCVRWMGTWWITAAARPEGSLMDGAAKRWVFSRATPNSVYTMLLAVHLGNLSTGSYVPTNQVIFLSGCSRRVSCCGLHTVLPVNCIPCV